MWIVFNGITYLFSLTTLLLLFRKKNLKKAVYFFAVLLLLLSINNLILPFFGALSKRILFVLIFILNIAFLVDILKQYISVPKKISVLLQIIYCFIIAAGLFEGSINALYERNLVKLYSPLVIVSRNKGDDWRSGHITGDKSKVYDPVLFWKPSDKYPYNKYSFKGKEFRKEKSNKKRIFFYGDSNTDGQDALSYPLLLQKMTESSAEIINAGVAGWSSYQGLNRIIIDYREWNPDIIFFSFGWNDCAGAMGKQDKEYSPPSKIIVSVQRFLLNYKGVLYILDKAKKRKITEQEYIPRVSKNDYKENISEVLSLCRENNIRLILLTRPYAYDSTFFKTDSTFRRFVPEYNDAVRELAKINNVEIIDVQKEFENKIEFFADESHFNENGYENLAKIIFEYLK